MPGKALKVFDSFQKLCHELQRGWHDFPASDGGSSMLNTARSEAPGAGNMYTALVSSVYVILPPRSSQQYCII